MRKEVIEFFCGAGLAALGLARAGFKHILACDWNPMALASFMANFPGVPVDARNLYLYSVGEILGSHCIRRDWDGLVWLSCPCQGASTAGNQLGRADSRNSLFSTVLEAAEYLPKAWIILENVPGLLKGEARDVYEDLKKALEARGRTVHLWRIDGADCGLAAKRPRIFVVCPPIGWQGSISEPRPRYDEHFPADVIGADFLDPDPDFMPLRRNDAVCFQGIGPGKNHLATELGRRYYAMLGKNNKGRTNFLARPAWDKHYPTLVCAGSGVGYRMTMIHPEKQRLLTVGEMRALMGLPVNFVLCGNLEQRMEQVGNGVAPVMACEVGKAIFGAAGDSIENPPDVRIIQGDALDVLKRIS